MHRGWVGLLAPRDHQGVDNIALAELVGEESAEAEHANAKNLTIEVADLCRQRLWLTQLEPNKVAVVNVGRSEHAGCVDRVVHRGIVACRRQAAALIPRPDPMSWPDLIRPS